MTDKSTLLTWLDAAVDRMGRLAAWTMVALVLLVSTNVLVRYFLHEGSVWSQELEWHLLVPIALFGIPYALANDEHVRVDILYERFSDRGQEVIDLFAAVVGICVALLLIKFSIPYVEQSWRNGEFQTLQALNDVAGAAFDSKTGTFLTSNGRGQLVQLDQQGLSLTGRVAELRWDNHMEVSS